MLYDLVLELRSEFPEFELIDKTDSRLMRAIDLALRILSFGQMCAFMSRFVTTVGYKVYVPPGWWDQSPFSRMVVLRHERVHMRQRKKYGPLLFSLLYLLLPVPVVFAYFRAKFEKEAYEETFRAIAELMPSTGALILTSNSFRDRTIKHFTRAEYLWMWPWRRGIERWYDSAVRRLLPK